MTTPSLATLAPLLRMNNICKSFPGVQALKGVGIELRPGQVLGLIGENGAGKSTLLKILAGVQSSDSGTIEIEGKPVDLSTPQSALQAGIGVIYQEFNLVPFLTARENLFLGQPQHSWGFIDTQKEKVIASKLFARLGNSLDPETIVASLSIAQKQIVEIAKALNTDVRILVMDEPTATLTPSEVAKLFQIVNELKAQGIGVIYVSHRLDEILEIADNVVVLRDGELIDQKPIAETHRRQLIEMMVGRPFENEYPIAQRQVGRVRLAIENLSWSNKVRDVSFAVHAGEVLGITGLVGAGRTEVAHLIAGFHLPDSGTIYVDDRRQLFRSPRDAILTGVCLLTEDRQGQGLVLGHSVQENFGLPNLDRFSTNGVLNLAAETKSLLAHVERLKIKIASRHQCIRQLSGGNQQKIVLAKWLERDCKVFVIDEPTRGIDVGAKYEIYLLINELATQGKAVIMISSEMPEIMGMSDRILVMREGRIAGEIDQPRLATQKKIMQLAAN